MTEEYYLPMPSLYLEASLRLIKTLSQAVISPREGDRKYAGQQAWDVLGCLGAEHLEKAGIDTDFHQVVEGLIPLAIVYNPHAEGILSVIAHNARSYFQAAQEDGDWFYPDGMITTEPIEFLLHASLAGRWVGSFIENLDHAVVHGDLYAQWDKEALQKEGKAAQITLLLKQVGEYESWVTEQIKAGGEVADYLAIVASHCNWMSNTLAMYGLAGTKEVEGEHPDGSRWTRQVIDLNPQQRENIPDWLLKLLTLAKMLE